MRRLRDFSINYLTPSDADGQLDVFHFDFCNTALSKTEQGAEGNFADVLALFLTG